MALWTVAMSECSLNCFSMKRLFPVFQAFVPLILLASCGVAGGFGANGSDRTRGVPADKPLYADPVHDGAADPFVIRNRDTGEWYMFYTSRRANVEGLHGVEWCHGTAIGIAVSKDGAHWRYLRDAELRADPRANSPAVADAEFRGECPTGARPGNSSTELRADGTGVAVSWWAPAVVDDGREYHLFVTLVPGVFGDWEHPRSIVHFTGPDLLTWELRDTLSLRSDHVIDPEVVRMDDGTWRLWYNDERAGKGIAFADSPDLARWADRGVLTIAGCEAPSVFRWKGLWWMLTDEWHGLRVWRSRDAMSWEMLPDCILSEPGTGPDDGAIGGHCDVVVSGERAYVFYFTHPGRTPGWDSARSSGNGNANGIPASRNGNIPGNPVDNYRTRRSVIQVTELYMAPDSSVFCRRDNRTFINFNIFP